MTTLPEIERHPVIQQNFGVLADAARAVASPQIPHSATHNHFKIPLMENA
jgi:CO/xanthine dehydrogenase FAD-binding subunit